MRSSFFRKSYFLLIGKLFGKKVIFHLHSPAVQTYYEKSSSLKKELIKKIFNSYDRIVVLSNVWKKVVKTITDSKISVIHNPVQIKNINSKSSNNSEVSIIVLGEIGERKGSYDIVEAAKLIKHPNIKITMYGSGDIEQVQNLINNNNLNDKLKLGGWIKGEDIKNAYSNADIYILPSYQEGLPMSVLEAMSYGLPIISTPVGGTPDAVENEVNGFLIEPGDYRSLAEKIEFLAENQELRHQMGQKSYEIVKNKFDINIIAQELKNLYNEILNERP
jgi:glycosyltransferase involved in cell wall biosynthesis